MSAENTLGYHRDMCALAFGEDSRATKYLDNKIAEHPAGRSEEVVADERQVIHLLTSIHLNGEPKS